MEKDQAPDAVSQNAAYDLQGANGAAARCTMPEHGRLRFAHRRDACVKLKVQWPEDQREERFPCICKQSKRHQQHGEQILEGRQGAGALRVSPPPTRRWPTRAPARSRAAGRKPPGRAGHGVCATAAWRPRLLLPWAKGGTDSAAVPLLIPCGTRGAAVAAGGRQAVRPGRIGYEERPLWRASER